jgi:hypothetical protein
MIVRKHGDWLAARVGDEVLMMSATEGRYLGLSEVGAIIWDLIDTPRSTEDIYAALEDEFAVASETCRAEVDAFLRDLAGQRAIVIETPIVG